MAGRGGITMKRQSIWQDDAHFPSFAPLDGDLSTDVLIIGGGMAGILCARMLASEGIDYALVEKDTLCSGVTKNTTAKITLQHGLIYHKLIKRLGREQAQQYLTANQAALNLYREWAESIDCDYQTLDNFVYSTCDRNILMQELAALNSLKVPAEYVRSLPLPIYTKGAIRVPAQAQFHPLKFAASICRGLNIFEHTRVLELAPNCIRTERGRIHARRIIVATHFPMLNKHGSYFMKLYQHRSYVLALNCDYPLDGMYVDENDKGMSFRRYGDYMLLGGGGHRTGKKGGSYPELHAFTSRHYPDANPVMEWAAQDCMSLDGIPYIGQYSGRTPDLYVTAGFNKWGMTGAMVGAMLLSGIITGKTPEWAEIFNPSRSMLTPQLLINASESAFNLITPVVPRCPHMGCALKYNPHEHSWDCPCHGSRFTEDGKLIDNPATGDLKEK